MTGQTTNTTANTEPPWIHVRREPFEFGLLPFPSLMQNDGFNSLKALRQRLLAAANVLPPSSSAASKGKRVSSAAIAACLGLTDVQGRLVLDTLCAVLPDDLSDRDALSRARASEVETTGADVDYLVVLLYLQLYKRAPHRAHRDAAAVADVWPSSSPFDGFATAPSSPLQLKVSASGSKRAGPQLLEEEVHQLQFVQKHLSNIVSLLTDAEEEGDGSKVISSQSFERLSLLLRVGTPGITSLSDATPFFANADPAMPAAPVPSGQVQEWLARHLCGSSALTRSTTTAGTSGGDVSMVEAGAGGGGPGAASSNSSLLNGVGSASMKEVWPEGMTCVDGITKMSVLKGESDIEAGVIRVSHCHDSVVYVLAPLRYASVIGCTDSIVVLGAAGKMVKVENCERVQVIVPCSRIRIANCRECVFYLGTNVPPVVLGDNHNLQVAPYNTFYPRLDAHLAMVGVEPSYNRWDSPVTLGIADPHDGISHPAGTVDAPGEPATLLLPERFVPFVVPFRGGGNSNAAANDQPQTRANPFALPKPYLAALQQKTKAVENLRQTLKTAVIEENKKRELTNVIQAHFKEWLFASGNIRQVYDLARLDRDP